MGGRVTATRYTPEEREAALAFYVELGAAEAAKVTGIKASTLRGWANRYGVTTARAHQVQAATDAAMAGVEERKAKLALDLLADAERMRRQLWEATTLHQLGSGGKDALPEWHALALEQPVHRDQLAIARAVDVLVRNVQLLTGEPTEREELVQGLDLEAELRAYQQGHADASAQEPAAE